MSKIRAMHQLFDPVETAASAFRSPHLSVVQDYRVVKQATVGCRLEKV